MSLQLLEGVTAEGDTALHVEIDLAVSASAPRGGRAAAADPPPTGAFLRFSLSGLVFVDCSVLIYRSNQSLNTTQTKDIAMCRFNFVLILISSYLLPCEVSLAYSDLR